LFFDQIPNLFAVNRDLNRGLDPDPALIPTYVHESNHDAIANADFFSDVSGKYEHWVTSMYGNGSDVY
jgi:hypothetical protein